MNRNRTVIILVACALIFSFGAYLLINKQQQTRGRQPKPITTSQTISPQPATPKAPQQVAEDQNAPLMSEVTQEVSPPLVVEEKKTPDVIEIKEDKFVTLNFVESLSDYLLNQFVPQGRNGKPTTLASIKNTNIYFGQEMTGFATSGDDANQARQSLLDYAFNPPMIKTLYALYTPVLLAHIVDTATSEKREYRVGNNTETRVLNQTETAAMLRLNAHRIEQAAQMLRAIGTDATITETAGKYLQAQQAVSRANTQLQNDMAVNRPTGPSSKQLKRSIVQREKIKKSLIEKMKKTCPNGADADLFYLAQWGYRRILGNPEGKLKACEAAADALKKLSQEFRDTAKQLQGA